MRSWSHFLNLRRRREGGEALSEVVFGSLVLHLGWLSCVRAASGHVGVGFMAAFMTVNWKVGLIWLRILMYSGHFKENFLVTHNI